MSRGTQQAALAADPELGPLARYGLVATCAAALGGLIAIFVLTRSPLVQPDFAVYFHAARAVLHGVNPYPQLGSSDVYSQHAFVYPYLSAYAFAPLGELPYHLAQLLFLVLSCGACVLTAVVLRGREPVGRILLGVVLVLLAAPSVRSIQVGAINPFLLLLLALAWRLRARSVASGLLLGVAVAFKLFLAPMLVWPVVAGRARSAGVGALTAAALLLAGFSAGPLGVAGYRTLLDDLAAHEGPGSSAPARWLFDAGLSWRAAEACAVVLAGAVLVVGAVAARRRRDERLVFGAAVLASLFVSPIVWSHYFLVALVPVLILMRLSLWRVAFIVTLSWALFPADTAALGLPDPVMSAGWALRLVVCLGLAAALVLQLRRGWRPRSALERPV